MNEMNTIHKTHTHIPCSLVGREGTGVVSLEQEVPGKCLLDTNLIRLTRYTKLLKISSTANKIFLNPLERPGVSIDYLEKGIRLC